MAKWIMTLLEYNVSFIVAIYNYNSFKSTIFAIKPLILPFVSNMDLPNIDRGQFWV